MRAPTSVVSDAVTLYAVSSCSALSRNCSAVFTAVAAIVVLAALAMPLASNRLAASKGRGIWRIGGLRGGNPDSGVTAGCRVGQKSWEIGRAAWREKVFKYV